MGLILSRVRKKKSAVETLEKLENDIKQMEEERSNAQMRHKRLTKMFLVYSLGLYVLFGLFLYFQYTATIQVKLLYLVPLAVSPLLLYIIKRIISWYYVRRINKNQIKLNEMKKEKKRILDEVMDKETYKVAKEILEKFSNDSRSILNLQKAPISNPNEGLRKRVVSLPNSPRQLPPGSPGRNFGVNQPPWPTNLNPMPNKGMQGVQGPGQLGVRTPVPILPLNRSYVDRVVEYLIGDGPNNRYALICSQCHSHNGMALKEEFEYIGFKCCYCLFYNPARKMRPEAPKLDMSTKEHKEYESDSDSKNSNENSDSEFNTHGISLDKFVEEKRTENENPAEPSTIKSLKFTREKSESEDKGEGNHKELSSSEAKEDVSGKEKSQNDGDCDEPLLKS